MNSKVVQIGHPALRQIARALTLEEIRSTEIQALIKEMCAIMREAPGVGLAAPQIGLSLQMIVIEDRIEYMQQYFKPEELAERGRAPVEFHVLFNPKIVASSLETVRYFEGCLSCNGLLGDTPRAKSVKVEALDHQGQPITIDAQDWYARILQHEIDHLNGILNVDRQDLKTLTTRENYWEFWHET